MIPAWVVSALAFMAALALWTVRPMPLNIRISVIAPLVYFGGLYLFLQTIPSGTEIYKDLVRLGLILIFFPIIVNSVIVRRAWNKNRQGNKTCSVKRS